jgi:hypothetical protein
MAARSTLIKYGFSLWRNYKIAFGTVIFEVNMANCKKSPILENGMNAISILRVTLLSLFKGTLYGITYPISPIYVMLDFESSFFDACHYNDAMFRRHYIPGSVYCIKKPNVNQIVTKIEN